MMILGRWLGIYIPLVFGLSLTVFRSRTEIKKKIGTITCPERLLLLSKRTRYYAMARRRKTKIVCISCYGHSRSTIANTPPFSGTAESHGSPYMDQDLRYHTAERNKKWGLITLMIFSAALSHRKCVYRNTFYISPFFSPTSHKLLLLVQKKEYLVYGCASSLFQNYLDVIACL